jgi:hypothetical protein
MTEQSRIEALEVARTATLRRVGRNLFNVQRIETMLKFLRKLNFTGSLQELEAAFKAHLDKVSRKTLRTLIPEIADLVLSEGDAVTLTRDASEVWIANSVKVPMDAEARAAWIKKWETLRNERNKLVHLMLAHVDFNSPEQCQELDLDLDAQNVLFLNGIAFLGPIVTAAREAIAEMASAAPANSLHPWSACAS